MVNGPVQSAVGLTLLTQAAAKDFLTNIKLVKKKFNKNTINKHLDFINNQLKFYKFLSIKNDHL